MSTEFCKLGSPRSSPMCFTAIDPFHNASWDGHKYPPEPANRSHVAAGTAQLSNRASRYPRSNCHAPLCAKNYTLEGEDLSSGKRARSSGRIEEVRSIRIRSRDGDGVGGESPAEVGTRDVGFRVFDRVPVRAAVLLNVPKILRAAGPGVGLSAAEICQHFEDPAKASPQKLEQILDVLGCHGILNVTNEGEKTEKKKNALTDLSQDLAEDVAGDYVRLVTVPEMIQFWPNIHQMVLDTNGPSPFRATYGKNFHAHMKEDVPPLAELYVGFLSKLNAIQLECLLEHYDTELRALTGTVVDVGGSEVALAAALASRYRNLRRVLNFDMPDVVARAPAFQGVEHVGGDFYEFVPKGDLLILKLVLLNGNEEFGVRLLRKCHEALPAKGKAIIVESVIDASQPRGPAEQLRMRVQRLMPSVMGGQLRSVQDIRRIAETAGFARVRVALTVDTLAFVEIEKD